MLISKQAEELNKIITAASPVLFQLLSERGKAVFFPKEGIVAQSAQAKGKKINATIGVALADDSLPLKLKSIADKVLLDSKDVFLYAPSEGKKELREEWKKEMLKKNPSLKSPISLPIVTQALTHALSIAGYLFLNEEDKVIIPDPYWGNYKLVFTNTYGSVIETFAGFSNYGFNVSAMKEKLIGGGKKIILLNFPSNPNGYSPSKKEAMEIVIAIKEAAEHGGKIVVLIDDAYFGLFYEDDTEKESLFSKLADLHENVLAVKLDGPTKEYYAWGLRVGFITFGFKGATAECYKALEEKAAGAVRGTISNASNLSQSLILAAFKSPSIVQEKSAAFSLLKERYLEAKKVSSDKKFEGVFEPMNFNSGYFMCVRPLKADAEKVRLKLLEKYDTGVISTSGLIRVSFSSVPKKDISALFNNIYSACLECE